MTTVDYNIRSATEFYNQLRSDENGRYSSWEYCYGHAELLKGTEIAVPDNVVTPSLKDELIKAGVKVSESGKVNYSTAQRADLSMTGQAGVHYSTAQRDKNILTIF